MASGMRLIVSCISSFLILSLLLFMVHRLRQRRRERIESLIGANCECAWPCLCSHCQGPTLGCVPFMVGSTESRKGQGRRRGC